MDCPRCSLPTKDKTGPYRRSAEPHIERPPLKREQHPAGIEIDRCPDCGGVFLDAGELEAIETSEQRVKRPDGYSPVLERLKRSFQHAHRPELPSSEDDPPPLACPKCGEPMFSREWGIGTLVMVDVCIDCRGVWLEGEELSDLERLFTYG